MQVCSITYARIQGKNAMVAHFQNSSLLHEDKRCRPVLFHSHGPLAGLPEPFPAAPSARCAPPPPPPGGLFSPLCPCSPSHTTFQLIPPDVHPNCIAPAYGCRLKAIAHACPPAGLARKILMYEKVRAMCAGCGRRGHRPATPTASTSSGSATGRGDESAPSGPSRRLHRPRDALVMNFTPLAGATSQAPPHSAEHPKLKAVTPSAN